MQHWDREKYRRKVSRRVTLMICAMASVAVVAGKSRSKDLGKAPRINSATSMRVAGMELSGIRITADTVNGEYKVALVGDRSAILHDVVVSSDLKLLSQETIEFGQAVEDRFALCHNAAGNNCKESLDLIKSQWEAIAIDGAGKNFLLQEYSRAILVMDGALHSVENVLNFDFSSSRYTPQKRSKRYRQSDDNLSAEGFLLMKKGHVLIAKEKSPTVIAEFGPVGSAPMGVNQSSLLGPAETFDLSAISERQSLVLLAEWQIADYGKCDISDLAKDSSGSIYVLSENCGMVQKFDQLLIAQPAVVAVEKWRLPKTIRNPEGLFIDSQKRFWISSDIKDEGDNIFIVNPRNLAE